MRDPVERLASHYRYWRRVYDPATSLPLHRRVVEEDWPFERFYRSAEMRNLYAQFLWGVGLSGFSFIGITEAYEEDLRFFARAFLGRSLPVYRENENDGGESRLHVTDPELRNDIAAHHRRDMLLYQHALELRRRRMAWQSEHGQHPDGVEPKPGLGRD